MGSQMKIDSSRFLSELKPKASHRDDALRIREIWSWAINRFLIVIRIYGLGNVMIFSSSVVILNQVFTREPPLPLLWGPIVKYQTYI